MVCEISIESTLMKVNKVRNRLVTPSCVDPAHFRPSLGFKLKFLYFENRKTQDLDLKKPMLTKITVTENFG